MKGELERTEKGIGERRIKGKGVKGELERTKKGIRDCKISEWERRKGVNEEGEKARKGGFQEGIIRGFRKGTRGNGECKRARNGSYRR